MRRTPWLMLLVLAAGAARANSITDEVGVGATQTTPANPRSGNISNNLAGSFDLSDQWVLNAGVSLIREGATEAPAGSPFGGSASVIAGFTGGLELDATDSLSLTLGGQYSPTSTQVAASQLTLGNGTSVDSLLNSKNTNGSVDLGLSWDSAGESDVEWGLNASVEGDALSTEQRVTELVSARGVAVSPQQVYNERDRLCAQTSKKTNGCTRWTQLAKALEGQSATLDYLKLSLGGTLTLWRDTDVSLSGDYYAYDQDPTTVAYFSIGDGARSVSGGGGVAIAPLRFLVRPEVAHRFGPFSVKLWVAGGQYVDQTGQATRSVGTRLQYKFSKAFRLWASASFQKDTDADGNDTNSGTFALGAGYRF